MMKFFVVALSVLAVAGPAVGQAKSDAAPRVVTVEALPESAQPRPLAFARVRAKMQNSETVGTLRGGLFCTGNLPIPWSTVAPSFSRLKDIFAEELTSARFKPDADPGNLFADQQSNQTDLQVGALFKSADISGCRIGNRLDLTVRLDVEWQVYSSLKKEVVATVETTEGAQKSRLVTQKNEGRSVYQEAFAANVRSFLEDGTLRKIVTSPAEATPSVATGNSKTPIQLVGATTRPTPIPDAVGSVVTIFAGSTFGSGVLVSSDGYLLTNHHVVGESAEVRIRWSDGFETTGRVIRSDKRRDVALVKTEARGRTALALSRAEPPPGTPVYAIGAPLDPQLQSTVTRGIVSANRIVDGFSFIQSDTPVTHGNSGGPLLDEHGAVIGLTDWGVPAEKGSSLNFFIPIGDALDFLALKPADGAPLPQAAAASRAATKP